MILFRENILKNIWHLMPEGRVELGLDLNFEWYEDFVK